jgi:hypothetical protein
MSRKGPVLIAGIALVVICVGIWGLQAMTRQPKPTVAEQQNHQKSAPWVRMAPEVTIFF